MEKLSKSILKNLRLTEAEASVYLAALELGEANMQDLARKSRVKRTSIYNFIDQLKERQLIFETRKHKRNVYSAVDPELLLEIENDHVAELRQLLPELNAIHNRQRKKPKVTFYEGKEGILEVYADTLKEKQPIVAYSDFEHMTKVLGQKFIEEYPKERSRRSVTFSSIARDTPQAREIARKNYGQLREMKYISSGDLETEINIYGNKVALISFRSSPPFAVLVEDKGIAETLRTAWKELWHRL